MNDLFLGIDGGGTKTEAVLVDGSGVVLGSARAAASAVVGEPDAASCVVLRRAAADACAPAGVSPGEVAACGLGLNGIDFADMVDRQRAALSDALGVAPECLHLVNDGIVALWAATAASAAAIVQHGTGFTAAYRRCPGEERTFDHLDAGDTFDMRSALSSAVARMIDGRLPATALLEEALAHYGVARCDEYAERLYRGRIDAERLRASAPLVFAAWRRGDAVATDLVERAAGDYVAAARAMISRIGCAEATVAFGGGVILCGGDEFWRRLASMLHAPCPEARVTRPALAPAFGGALLAAHARGCDAARLHASLVEHSGTGAREETT